MRPIHRGSASCSFKHYRDARPLLLEKLGDYCSYCERPASFGLEVEHILPKKIHPEFELDWNNFLLACRNCNATKSYKDFTPEQVVLPDRDNTFLAFTYDRYGRVKANPNLSPEIQTRVEKTIELTGINKPKSRLIEQRRKAWLHINETWRKLQNQDSSRELHEREWIAREASLYGYFSIWMTVFADDPDMRKRFIKAFKGTATDCFDDDGAPVPRPGGKI